jgi:hypothetical protein
MNRNRIIAIVTLVLAAAVGGYQVKAHAQQQYPKPCTVVIPTDWGKYKGVAAGSGLVFEDKNGTLRITSQIPCNIDGSVASAPQIMVEIHRK